MTSEREQIISKAVEQVTELLFPYSPQVRAEVWKRAEERIAAENHEQDGGGESDPLLAHLDRVTYCFDSQVLAMVLHELRDSDPERYAAFLAKLTAGVPEDETAGLRKAEQEDGGRGDTIMLFGLLQTMRHERQTVASK